MRRIERAVREMVAARRRVEQGESRREEIAGPLGVPITIRSRADGAVEMSGRWPASPRVRTWPADRQNRPPEYPDGLPYLPGVRVSVTELGTPSRRVVSWSGDSGATLDRLERELTASGWVRRSSRGRLFGLLGRKIGFGRGDRTVRLSLDRFPGRPPRLRLIEEGTR